MLYPEVHNLLTFETHPLGSAQVVNDQKSSELDSAVAGNIRLRVTRERGTSDGGKREQRDGDASIVQKLDSLHRVPLTLTQPHDEMGRNPVAENGLSVFQRLEMCPPCVAAAFDVLEKFGSRCVKSNAHPLCPGFSEALDILFGKRLARDGNRKSACIMHARHEFTEIIDDIRVVDRLDTNALEFI